MNKAEKLSQIYLTGLCICFFLVGCSLLLGIILKNMLVIIVSIVGSLALKRIGRDVVEGFKIFKNLTTK